MARPIDGISSHGHSTGWDWPRTLTARGSEPLAVQHLRRKPAAPGRSRLHCMLLDCSGSMVSSGALALAKGVLIDFMEEAYRCRDHIALICFGGAGVELRMPPSKAASWNDDWIAPIGGSGGTPLQQGLQMADSLMLRHGSSIPHDQSAAKQTWLWLLTDARTREQPVRPTHVDKITILDFDGCARRPLQRARALADAWGADYRCEVK